MVRVSLTGGIATGKSYVLEQFRRRGVPCLDADGLVHAMMAPGTDVSAAVARRFGARVLAPDGAIDRKMLAPVVFGDTSARHDLEAIVHPIVYRAIKARLDAFELAGDAPLAVVDIPLLYETGHAHEFDRVIVTVCAPDVQIRRLVTRDGLSTEEARDRLAAQMPTAAKAARADFLIHTDGSTEETDRQVDRVYRELMDRKG